MTLTSGEIRVAGTGELALAAVGSTLPTSPTASLDAAFTGYGYTTEDGVTLGRSVTRDPVMAWQSVVPVRYLTTEQAFTVQATMLQSNLLSTKLWLNSGDFAQIGATQAWTADVPVTPTGQQFAVVVTWTDSATSVTTRLVIAKAEVTDHGDIQLSRSATGYQVTLSALAPDSGTTFATWMTNDTAYDPT
jgi:hypothetical protein